MLKNKVVHCFVDQYRTFDRVFMKVMDWAMRKKGIPDVLVGLVMSLYEGAKIRVRLDSEFKYELWVEVGMDHVSELSPFLLAVVLYVVTEFVCEVTLFELLYTDDIVMMSETIEGLRNKFLRWKEAFVGNGFKINLVNTKVMDSCGITKDNNNNGYFQVLFFQRAHCRFMYIMVST